MENSSSTSTKTSSSLNSTSNENSNEKSTIINDYSTSTTNPVADQREQSNENLGQHQISTTVTTNRQSNNNNYGTNLLSTNSNGNSSTTSPSTSTSNPSTTNSYKLKQQRNYQNNRFDPMGTQSAGYQARNAAAAAAAAAAQLHHPWNNSNVLSGQNPTNYSTTNLTTANTFALPHHYPQQTVDMYANYYAATAATPYATHPTQHNAYGQYGQTLIPQESPKGGHVIYVYGIGQRATQEEIFALFQPFGRVLRVDIIIDFNTGLCKGYAFVAMEQYQDAQMAIQSLNAAPFHGRQLQVRFKS